MQDLFHPKLDLHAVNAVSSLGLAHLGDAVYEIMVRTMLIMDGHTTGIHLHQEYYGSGLCSGSGESG